MTKISWITLYEDKGKIVLVSTHEADGIIHIGSYLTIEEKNEKGEVIKHILRVEETHQNAPYSPSPLVIDMDLSALVPDQKCQNVIMASRIIEHPERLDGKSSFIKPQVRARKSNQEEIDLAFGSANGLPVFPATLFARNSQHLIDNEGKFIQVKVPEETFFHQMMITGRTGSGKTVAMKYIAQYFLEKLDGGRGGAVLAVNVKEEDLLTLDKSSQPEDKITIKEWEDLGEIGHGVETFRTYYPGNRPARYSSLVDGEKCERITLRTENIEPETLTGLIQNISSLGADQLPAIFRYWQRREMSGGDTLSTFVRYFGDRERNRIFTTLNNQDEAIETQLHPSTHSNILRALTNATEYFDLRGAREIRADDILQRKKCSVIDVTSRHGFGFGSVLLRDLLDKLYEANSQREKNERVPILIIIDEVHEFYNAERSREALESLNLICRKGRSLKMGVIFASQNPEDIPRGISNVVNSKIFFKSDSTNLKSLGVKISGFDSESLKKGFAVTQIHGLSQLKFIKFPLSFAGVNVRGI